MPDYILALDQGTTSSRAILFDREGNVRASANQEFHQHYQQPGWVDHDAEEIWQSQLAVTRRVLLESGAHAQDVAAVGITNQRETAVLWDRQTSQPLHRAIVWQCRRTAGMCDRIRQAGFDPMLREMTRHVTHGYLFLTQLAWM